MGLCSACNAPVDEGVEKCANCAEMPAEAPVEAPAPAPEEGGDSEAA